MFQTSFAINYVAKTDFVLVVANGKQTQTMANFLLGCRLDRDASGGDHLDDASTGLMLDSENPAGRLVVRVGSLGPRAKAPF